MLVIRPGREQQGSPISIHDSFRKVASSGVATPESLGGCGETAVCIVEQATLWSHPHLMPGGEVAPDLLGNRMRHGGSRKQHSWCTSVQGPQSYGRAGKIGVIDWRCLLQPQEGRR